MNNTPTDKSDITFNSSVSGIPSMVKSLEAEDTFMPISPLCFAWQCPINFSNYSGFPSYPGGMKTVQLIATSGGLSAREQNPLRCEPDSRKVDSSISGLSTDSFVFKIRDHYSQFKFAFRLGASEFIKQVIFNLNVESTGDQTFDSGITYHSTFNGNNVITLLSLSGNGYLLTMPCFTEGFVDPIYAALKTQKDPHKVLTMTGIVNEVFACFGCRHVINQTQAQFSANPSPADGEWNTSRKTIETPRDRAGEESESIKDSF